jgi:hypothetical protein
MLGAIADFARHYDDIAKRIIDANDKINEGFVDIYSDKAGVTNYLKGYSDNIDYSSEMANHILNGGRTYDVAFQ